MKPVFIMFSADNQPIAQKLAERIQAQRAEPILWDPDSDAPTKLPRQTRKQILNAAAVLVLWTPQSYRLPRFAECARLAAGQNRLLNLAIAPDHYRLIPETVKHQPAITVTALDLMSAMDTIMTPRPAGQHVSHQLRSLLQTAQQKATTSLTSRQRTVFATLGIGLWLAASAAILYSHNFSARHTSPQAVKSKPDTKQQAAAHKPATRSLAALISPAAPEPVSAAANKQARIKDTSSLMINANSPITSLTLAPNGRQMAYTTKSGKLHIIPVPVTSNAQPQFTHKTDGILLGAVFSLDGKNIIISRNNGELKRIRIAPATPSAAASIPVAEKIMTAAGQQPSYALAIAPITGLLASAGSGTQIKLWNANTGQLQKTLTAPASPIYALAFSPDGQQLVSASSDGTIVIHDLKTGQPLRTLYGLTGEVNVVRYSPDGTLIAAASGQKIQVWSAKSGKFVAKFIGQQDIVTTLGFAPDNAHIIAAGADARLMVWRIGEQRPVRVLTGHNGPVYAVALSPDGRTLYSAGEDGKLRRWRDVISIKTVMNPAIRDQQASLFRGSIVKR